MKKNILILLFLSACTNYEYEPAELEPELLTEPLQSGRFRVNNSRIEGVAGTPTYARTANAVTDIDFMRCLLQAFPSANWVCYPDYQHRCACETYGTCPRDSGQLLEPRVYEGARGWEIWPYRGQQNTSISHVLLTQNNRSNPPVLNYRAQWWEPETGSWRQQLSTCRVSSDGRTAELTVSPSGRISGPTF